MLPPRIVTLVTFLIELSSASPIYNMQPAFITTNIGTTGRNIRNLPCISRKNNQSGICMFAIDCLKSNGTHLGTCIDRFYFGSCCHIEPSHDIIENTIDTDIIPVREPPNRLASTIKPISITTAAPSTTTSKPVKTTTNHGLSTHANNTTTKISTTSTPKPITTAKRKQTIKPATIHEQKETTTVGYKLTTFQSVDGIVSTETTTAKISKTTTSKPKPSSTKPVTTKPFIKPSTKPSLKPSTKPSLKPSIKPSIKPSTIKPKPTQIVSSKPVKITTKKPSQTTVNKHTTKKPQLSSTTRKPTKRPEVTTKPTKNIATTEKVNVTTTPIKIIPSTTTSSPNVEVSTKNTTVVSTTIKISSTTTTKRPINKMNVTSILESVNGNLATNEVDTVKPLLTTISSETTTKPSVVTWTVVDGEKNASKPIAITPSINSTTEEWIPLTTPDGWVLLPSVPPNTTSSLQELPSTSTKKTTTSSTMVTTQKPSSTVTITTESASKQPITYIPLESTTTSTSTALNMSTITIATEETVTSSTVGTPVTTTHATSTTPQSHIHPVNMSDFTDVCGRRMYPEARIVGGEKSSFGKWPWQVSLRQWRTSTYLHKCGAALLNENWAITAAHCVDNVPPSDLLLRLGEHDLSTESEPYLHQERRVQIVASHPQFDPRTFEYDLALLRFYEPVTFQPNILPVCVPQNDENFVGRTAHVTGWGRLYEDGPLPSVLQEVSVPVINNSVCESMYRSAGYIEHIPHIFICAGWRRGGFDSCEGDSGGPMVIQREDKRFMLAGVISWGIGCAEPNQPGVYTRISEFRDWINQILQF